MKEAEIEKTKCFAGPNYAIGLSKNHKIKALSCPNFSRKIRFCPILVVFWWKKGRGHTLKARNQNLTYPIAVSQLWGMFQYKKFGSSTSQFCGYRCQRSFFFNFRPHFRFGCFSRYHAPNLEKNEFDSWCRIQFCIE